MLRDSNGMNGSITNSDTMTTFKRDNTLYNALDIEDLYTLPLPVTPGSDSCGKALLRTDDIKDIIISSVVGSGICGFACHNRPTESNDNKRTDITYYPQDNTKNLAPVIVKIQKKVSHELCMINAIFIKCI